MSEAVAIATYPANYDRFHELAVGAMFDVVYPPAAHGEEGSINRVWHKVRFQVVVIAPRPKTAPCRMFQQVHRIDQGGKRVPLVRALTGDEIVEWEARMQRDFDEQKRRNAEFLAQMTLADWRRYFGNAVGVAEGVMKRPLTADEKRILWRRWKQNMVEYRAPSSYTALALVSAALDFK